MLGELAKAIFAIQHGNQCCQPEARETFEFISFETQDKDPEMVEIMQACESRPTTVMYTQCTMPVNMRFTVPENSTVGQTIIVDGPHGPLHVELPEGLAPGQEAQVRIGPETSYKAVAPEGAKCGDYVNFQLPNEQVIQVAIPEGINPGDGFEISPQVLMVRVPESAYPGMEVCFCSPDGSRLTTKVPENVRPLQYFEFPL